MSTHLTCPCLNVTIEVEATEPEELDDALCRVLASRISTRQPVILKRCKISLILYSVLVRERTALVCMNCETHLLARRRPDSIIAAINPHLLDQNASRRALEDSKYSNIFQILVNVPEEPLLSKDMLYQDERFEAIARKLEEKTKARRMEIEKEISKLRKQLSDYTTEHQKTALALAAKANNTMAFTSPLPKSPSVSRTVSSSSAKLLSDLPGHEIDVASSLFFDSALYAPKPKPNSSSNSKTESKAATLCDASASRKPAERSTEKKGVTFAEPRPIDSRKEPQDIFAFDDDGYTVLPEVQSDEGTPSHRVVSAEAQLEDLEPEDEEDTAEYEERQTSLASSLPMAISSMESSSTSARQESHSKQADNEEQIAAEIKAATYIAASSLRYLDSKESGEERSSEEEVSIAQAIEVPEGYFTVRQGSPPVNFSSSLTTVMQRSTPPPQRLTSPAAAESEEPPPVKTLEVVGMEDVVKYVNLNGLEFDGLCFSELFWASDINPLP